MTTITRQQLCDAIEAGITAVEDMGVDGFTARAASRLRAVAEQATIITRGDYVVTLPGRKRVRCPVAQAYPRGWRALTWDRPFTSAYDRATREDAEGATVLHVTDNDGREAGAA